jgi:hypothetical protein
VGNHSARRSPAGMSAGQPPRTSTGTWPDAYRQAYPPGGSPPPVPAAHPQQQPAPASARSARVQRPTRRYRTGALIFLACSAAVLVIVTIAVSLPQGSSKPPAPPALTAHQREIAAAAAWLHGDGDMVYKQYLNAMKAWTDHPTRANAVTWWQMAGISLRQPPPVGTVQWEAAMRDWEKAAQLAGGDPGAPTGGPGPIAHYLHAGSTDMAAANVEIAAGLGAVDPRALAALPAG